MTYPIETRTKAIALVKQGRTIKSVAQTLDINVNTISSWVADAGLTREICTDYRRRYLQEAANIQISTADKIRVLNDIVNSDNVKDSVRLQAVQLVTSLERNMFNDAVLHELEIREEGIITIEQVNE